MFLKGVFMGQDAFLDAMQSRFACKIFDKTKQIPSDIFESILESGRLAPSSFGLEPTRMILVQSDSMREQVKQACWGQNQITDASATIIYTSLKSDMLPHSNYVFNQLSRRVKTDEEIKYYTKKRYGQMKLEALSYLSDIEKLGLWSGHQAYIMATTMMNHAAFLGIDSCMIEGFDKKEIESCLSLDTFKEQVTLILCLGYRAMPQSKRLRLPLEDIVRII